MLKVLMPNHRARKRENEPRALLVIIFVCLPPTMMSAVSSTSFLLILALTATVGALDGVIASTEREHSTVFTLFVTNETPYDLHALTDRWPKLNWRMTFEVDREHTLPGETAVVNVTQRREGNERFRSIQHILPFNIIQDEQKSEGSLSIYNFIQLKYGQPIFALGIKDLVTSKLIYKQKNPIVEAFELTWIEARIVVHD